MFKLHYHPN
jgi:hypothetical protein